MNQTRIILRAFGASLIAAASLTTSHALAADQPSIEQFAVPSALHSLRATVAHTKSNLDVLKKIGGDFASGNQIGDVTYSYTAPDRVEAHGHFGLLSGSVVSTNTTERYDVGIFHHTKDISKDITRRQTISVLGILPQNYLDIMRSQYGGTDTVDGVSCDVFILRYITDQPDDKRRFMTWVSISRHYIVKQRVWDGGNHEHQTVFYKDPEEVIPGVWVPTQVEVYDAQGELGGVAEQKNISAN